MPNSAKPTYQWSASSGEFNKNGEPTVNYIPEDSPTSDDVILQVAITIADKTYSAKRTCTFTGTTAAGGPTAGPSPAPASTAGPAPTSEPAGGQASQVGGDPAPAPTDTPTSEPTAAPVPLLTSTPEPPTATPAPPPEDLPTTVRIAVQGPLSGKWGNQGIGIRNAVELAIREQGQAFKRSKGLKLEMAAYDDQSDEAIGKAVASEAARDPNVLCVVGHYNSGVTNAAYEAVYGPARMVVIPSSTNTGITDDNDTVWRLVGRDDIQGAVAASFAREQLDARSAYIVHDDSLYGRPAALSFQQNFLARQGEVLAFKPYNPDTLDFAPLIDEIVSQRPDLIYFVGVGEEAGEFIKQVRAAGSQATVLGSDGLDTSDILVSGGAAVAGTYFVTVAAPLSEFPGAARFAENYRATYRQEPTSFTAENYDAATLCIRAINKAAGQAGTGKKPSREQVLAAMQALAAEPFKGISGNYRFNSNGDPQVAKYYIFQITGGRWSDNKLVQSIAVNAPQP